MGTDCAKEGNLQYLQVTDNYTEAGQRIKQFH